MDLRMFRFLISRRRTRLDANRASKLRWTEADFAVPAKVRRRQSRSKYRLWPTLTRLQGWWRGLGWIESFRCPARFVRAERPGKRPPRVEATAMANSVAGYRLRTQLRRVPSLNGDLIVHLSCGLLSLSLRAGFLKLMAVMLIYRRNFILLYLRIFLDRDAVSKQSKKRR